MNKILVDQGSSIVFGFLHESPGRDEHSLGDTNKICMFWGFMVILIGEKEIFLVDGMLDVNNWRITM